MVRTYNLADLLEILAEAGPDRPALVAGTERRTYAQLDERASRVGRHLAAAGVRPGEHVAILSYNRVEWIEAMLGAFKIRAVPIPVNYRYVAAELRHVLADSDSVAIIGERSLLAKVAEIRGDLPLLRHLVVLEDGASDDVPGAVEYEKALAAADPSGGFPARSSDDRYIMYTGGTTGYRRASNGAARTSSSARSAAGTSSEIRSEAPKNWPPTPNSRRWPSSTARPSCTAPGNGSRSWGCSAEPKSSFTPIARSTPTRRCGWSPKNGRMC